MAISASQIATTNTLEQFRTEFNILRDDVSGLEDGSVTFSEISATTLGSSTINVQEDGTIVFEGATDNANQTTLTVIDPTGDHTITFPDQGGLVSLIGGIQTNADDDIVLDDVGSRLLLEDVMDGDTGSFLSSHGVTFANNDVSLSGKLVIGDGETIGSTSDTDSLSISSTGVVNFTQRPTFAASVTIQDGGSIGSSSDLNAVTISSGGVVAVTATTANTSATDGALTVAGGVGIAADLSVGDDVRLISDSVVLSFGADGDTTLTHTDGTGLTLNSTNKLTFGDAATFIHQSSNGVMTIDGEATIDLNASTAVLVSNDLKLNSDSAVIHFGADSDVTLTHAADTSLTLNVLMAATTFEPTGDTAAGDDAAIGYTAAEGLILTGHGSTSDVVIKNDADTTVMSIATGTDDVVFAGDVTVSGNLDVTGTFDLSDSNFTNAGDIQLDSITGDGDTNTSITFSGSDIITFATGGSTAATLNASQVLTLSGNLLIPDAGTIGSASDTDAMSISSGGVVNFSARPTFAASLTIQDGGSLGSASDLNAMTISSGGVVAVTATTASTNSTSGALTVAGGAGIAADLGVGDDLRMISDGAIVAFGADGDVTLTHVADTGLLLNTTMVVQFRDSAINIGSPQDGDLDINADDEIELNSTLIDINGNVEISGTLAQADALTMATNKKIIFRDSAIHISSTADGDMSIAADDEIDITSTLIDINGNVDISGTIAAADALTMATNKKIIFRDSAIHISSTADGDLSIAADDEIDITSTLIDINGNVEISGTLAQADAITMATNKKLIFRDAAIHISSVNDGDLMIVADDEIDITSTLIDINGAVEISGATTQTGISTSAAKDVFNAGMSIKNAASSAGFIEFFEDSDNGSNKVTLVGPASTADVTLILPAEAGSLSTEGTATALAIALG